ncbi:MAG: hypothetical protein WEA58_08595 [Balneolaceae bacterium]
MTELKVIESDINISDAWGQAFLEVYENNEVSPLIISVTDFPDSLDITENSEIRNALDGILKKQKKSLVKSVANTIFPRSLWNPSKDRSILYDRHTKILPSIDSCRPNRHGHYFRRMIDFDGDGKINQIEKVIEVWNTHHRHSGMQIALFDPQREHKRSKEPILGFPCLHQVSVDLYGSNGVNGLGLTAFYGTQYMLLKGYGNYLGLCRLGIFLAHEMGLKFTRFNCVSGKAKFNTSFRKTHKDSIKLVDVIKSNLK